MALSYLVNMKKVSGKILNLYEVGEYLHIFEKLPLLFDGWGKIGYDVS
jgi:hypothetical protein